MKKGAAAVVKASMSNKTCYDCSSLLAGEKHFYQICHECGKLQPSNERDPFYIYALEPSFIIDEKELEQKYFALQMQFHPDKFVTKSDKEKMIASQISMNINEAYQLLKDPIARADYLLTQKGLASIHDEEQHQASPVLLMEQMEKRLQLENARDAETLTNLYKQGKAALTGIMHLIQKAFENNELEEAQQQLLRLQYEQKFLQQVQAKQRSI